MQSTRLRKRIRRLSLCFRFNMIMIFCFYIWKICRHTLLNGFFFCMIFPIESFFCQHNAICHLVHAIFRSKYRTNICPASANSHHVCFVYICVTQMRYKQLPLRMMCVQLCLLDTWNGSWAAATTTKNTKHISGSRFAVSVVFSIKLHIFIFRVCSASSLTALGNN